MENIYELRRERLKALLKNNKLPALMVSLAANRYYLSGFELFDPQCNESAGMLVVTADGDDYLMTDPRYVDAAARVWPAENTLIYSTNRYKAMADFLKGKGVSKAAVEAKAMCVQTHGKLGEHLTLVPTNGIVEKLRLIKDPLEISKMEESCRLNHLVMHTIEEMLPDMVGRTEKELAWEVEKCFKDNGASHLSFDSIVAVGENAALCHAVPGETVIRENTMVLLDCGGRLDEYCSDQTRTFWVGDRPSDRFIKTREMVQQAQQEAIGIMRPGLPMADAYNAARNHFAKFGVEAQFTHALGHGIGLETHEPPSVGFMATEEVFRPGMVVTVEPGLYDPAWGGIRWEFMTLITEDGIKVL